MTCLYKDRCNIEKTRDLFSNIINVKNIFYLALFFTLSTKATAMENNLIIKSTKYSVSTLTEKNKLRMYSEESNNKNYDNYREFNRYEVWLENLSLSLIFSPIFLSHPYEHTKLLNDKDSILRIESFEFDSNEFEINQSIPVLSDIPTTEWGKAKYHLTLPLEEIVFTTFADRKKWTLINRYKSYVEIFRAKAKEEDYFLIEINEPNNYFKDNGLYLVTPKI